MSKQETSPRERGVHEARSAPPADASGDVPARQRVAKAMARAGLCSRREAEAWVLAGRVKVNGELLASPARDVGPDDVVTVDDQPLPAVEKTRLFLFHKPRGLVTSDHDPEGRETVTDFLRENWPEGPRVVTIGRLDINTEGLLLLTNDGGLARVLELPETGWMRRYRVRAKGVADPAALDALADGISIDGIDYAGIEARLDRVQGHNCWLTMGLREGKNREIKRILEHLGLGVNRLIRLSFGPFQLGELPDGAVEEVRTRVLRDQLGEALAAEAGTFFGHEEVTTTRVATAPIAKGGGTRRPRPAEPTRSMRPDRTSSDDAQRGAERGRETDGRRRHVSASRTMDEQRTRFGPRKRIERTDTKDRHDRPVSVERMVTSGAPSRSRFAKEGSPSAQGKRARVARSTGASDKEGTRGFRADRSKRDGDARPAQGRSERPFRSSRDGADGSRTGGGQERSRDRKRGSVEGASSPRTKTWTSNQKSAETSRNRPPRSFQANKASPEDEAARTRHPRPFKSRSDRQDGGRGDTKPPRRSDGQSRKPGNRSRPASPPKR